MPGQFVLACSWLYVIQLLYSFAVWQGDKAMLKFSCNSVTDALEPNLKNHKTWRHNVTLLMTSGVFFVCDTYQMNATFTDLQ